MDERTRVPMCACHCAVCVPMCADPCVSLWADGRVCVCAGGATVSVSVVVCRAEGGGVESSHMANQGRTTDSDASETC